MEKTGSREGYGSAAASSEPRPVEGRAGAGGGRSEGAAPRVPQQARSESRGGDSGRGGDTRQHGAGRAAAIPAAPVPPAGPVPLAAPPVAHAARGEHTHSETPIPQPRVVREGAREPRGAGGLPPAPAPGPAPASVPGLAFAVAAPRPVIQRVSVRGQVLDALRSALVAGDLAPGEVYSAPALGERFGVSATPVREAMQQLANEGAVEVVPNRGFRVIRRGARELAELAEIRALVEMPVMLRLTRTVAAPCWAELRALADATVAAAATGDLARYAESDRVFHAGVLALSGNRQLVQLADDLHRRAQWPLAGTPTRRPRADLLADAGQHTALLDALTRGDVPTAQSLIRDHFAGA
ncbi:GntR family transcriptional regulator [Streptomyces sp. NPDC020707]|uniref:GntR family transcriptional regulator n=1 Tax=Streptomyces TaxID=1883 RepID=UPI0035576344